MIVIIEGSDLVGKTTLVDGLVQKYDWAVVKLRWDLLGDPEIETRAMAKATTTILNALRPDVFLDRSYFSWWAYADPLGYPDSYMPELIARYRPVEETRLILLTCSAHEIKQRFERKPDLYFPLNVIQAANKRFPSLLPLLPSGLESLHIDTTRTTAGDMVRLAAEFISDRHDSNA